MEHQSIPTAANITIINGGRQVASAAPKIVQPSKLAHIDSQRIVAILHQSLDKLSLLPTVFNQTQQSSPATSSTLPPIDNKFSTKLKVLLLLLLRNLLMLKQEQVALMQTVDSKVSPFSDR